MKASNIKQKILISACLLGEKVRYDASDLLIENPLLKQWQQQGRLIPICPEVAGGMSTPRAPAEIMAGGGGGGGQTVLTHQTLVVDNTGKDVTQYFIRGAQKALALAKENHCVAAILTERSPSCGSHLIYDGSFSSKRIAGMGVTSALLRQNGISVFNQNQLEQLAQLLHRLKNVKKRGGWVDHLFNA